MPHRIIRLGAERITEVQAILRATWIDTYTGLLPEKVIGAAIEQWQSRDALLRGIDRPNVLFAGYEQDGSLLGVVRAAALEDGVMIFQLYVLPTTQRQGIGKALMDYTLAHFAGHKKFRLEVLEGNEKGISFYKKYGFTFPGKSVTMLGNDEIHNLEGELILD